jgi:Lanthionine synthetase C-like protein
VWAEVESVPSSHAATLLDGDEAERALEIAERVFERGLRWTEEHAGWAPESIGAFGGCALVADALLRAGRTVPLPLREIVRRALVTAPDRRGLCDGRAGLLIVLDALDPDGTTFARPRASLRAAIGADLLATRELDPADTGSFDLIRGAAGKLIALHDPPEDVAAHVRVLFTRFAERVEARLAGADAHAAQLDIGVAHGVPGILAALNLALPAERVLARPYADLVVRASHLVDGVRRWDDHWNRGRLPPPRRAWCYQTVGVAAVLHDRALLDGDEELRELALSALDGTLHEPPVPARWDDALCHGRAGVALIYSRIETADGRFVRAARELARTVLHGYRADAAFGYRAFNLVDGVEEDRPQFLDAALGIAMFLIDAARPAQRRWLPLLGLLPDGGAR